MKMTYAKMKELDAQAGNFYFTKDTISFLGSKIEALPNDYQLFIESVDDFNRVNRDFMVKFIGMDGNITTLEPKFVQDKATHFRTYDEAEHFRTAVTARLKQLCNTNNLKSCSEMITPTSKKLKYFCDSGVYKFTDDAGRTAILDTNFVFKYNFEYKFNAGFDVDITPATAQNIKEGKTSIDDIISTALLDKETGEAVFEHEGTYPEVLDGDTDSPYIHTRIYGSYTTECVGKSYEECAAKAKDDFEEADIGIFAEDSDFEIDGVYEEKLTPDCERLIDMTDSLIFELIHSADATPFDTDVLAAVNMDNSGISFRMEILDPFENADIKLDVYAGYGAYPNDIIPVVTDKQKNDLFNAKQLLGTIEHLSFDEFKTIVRGVPFDKGMDLVLDMMKNVDKKDIERD